MNLKQTVYFMALVGATAGLVCWVLQAFLSDVLSVQRAWALVAIYAALMGGLIGGMTVGFADHWTSDRVTVRWVLTGLLLGILAGLLTGALYLVVAERLITGAESGAGRVVPWLTAGALIGVATGMRWASVNTLRTFHAFAGGLLGGVLGGLLYLVLGDQPFGQALAYMCIGSGITLGVTLAPVLLSDGVLQFVSSGDPRAQNKYGNPRQEWVIQDGDELVIGSQGGAMTSTLYAQEVQIYIPDAMVALKHAILFARHKRFYLQLHPDNAGPLGQPLDPLQLGDENVTTTREMRDGDEIVVGQTLLRFKMRRKPASSVGQAGRNPR